MQNKQIVVEAGHSKNFFHPYMQVALRTLSQTLCLLLVIPKGIPFRAQEGLKVNHFLIFLSELIDFATFFCFYIALNFIPSSIYQMLRGGTILTTYLFTLLLLKKPAKKHKIVGCLVVLLGIAIVGIVNIVLGQTKESDEKLLVIIGYGLIILGVIGSGLHFVIEQYLIHKYAIHPLWLISIEGVYGMLLSALTIPFFYFIICPFQDNACVFNDQGEAVVEDTSVYFRQIFGSTILLVAFFVILVGLTVYDSLGVVMSAKIGSLARAIVDVSRTMLIWIVAVIVTATVGKDNKSFKWESIDLWSIVGQGLGFMVLVFGNLIYTELVKLPFLQEKTQIDERDQT